MPIVKTHDLMPGMTLLQEIQNHSGRKLLPAGTLITEKHILNLKAWGISEASIKVGGVESGSAVESNKFDPQKLAKAEKEVGTLFCLSNQDHPAVIELMRLASLNRLKKMPEMGHVNVK